MIKKYTKKSSKESMNIRTIRVESGGDKKSYQRLWWEQMTLMEVEGKKWRENIFIFRNSDKDIFQIEYIMEDAKKDLKTMFNISRENNKIEITENYFNKWLDKFKQKEFPAEIIKRILQFNFNIVQEI